MKAIQANDKCLSTNVTGNHRFNTDGVTRDHITIEEGANCFNFEIHKKENFAYNPVTGEVRKIPGQYHLERSTDGAFIPSASIGEQFVPVQHKAIYEYVTKEIMAKVPQMKLEMVGTLHNCGTGVITATWGDTFGITNDDSPHVLRFIYANPCNGTGKLTMGFTNVRIVCQNTLMAAIKQAKGDGWAVKHTRTAEIKCDKILQEISTAAQAAIEMKRRSEVLANIGANTAMLNQALDAVYPTYGLDQDSPVFKHLQDKRERVLIQFESGETAQTMKGKTAWSLFNSFTYPIFNEARITKNTDEAQVAYKGMLGDVAYSVRDIFGKVEQIAKAA